MKLPGRQKEVLDVDLIGTSPQRGLEQAKPAWYAVHTNPSQESRTINNLSAWGLEAFTPWINRSVAAPSHSTTRRALKPLFPRYIFARFDAAAMLSRVRYTRGVHTVVSFGAGPTPVDESVIAVCKASTGEGGTSIFSNFAHGDSVVVNSGPLKDLIGVFEYELPASDRVIILLTSIRYQARIEARKSEIRKLDLPVVA